MRSPNNMGIWQIPHVRTVHLEVSCSWQSRFSRAVQRRASRQAPQDAGAMMPCAVIPARKGWFWKGPVSWWTVAYQRITPRQGRQACTCDEVTGKICNKHLGL